MNWNYATGMLLLLLLVNWLSPMLFLMTRGRDDSTDRNSERKLDEGEG